MLMTDVSDMYRKLADIATIDPLTCLHNRRSFDNHLGFILSLLRRSPSHVAMLLIDIDHFKNFNDTFGHAAGDTILTQVAASLKSVVTRPLDMVARWGGEEFVIVLPDTEREGVLTVADKARRIVESMTYASADGKVAAVTISIGIAYVSSVDLPNSMDMFRTADKSLYEAKANGRNQIVINDYRPAEAAPRARPYLHDS
jgi:diguanylate cyclase (GGDEF)-like protein